MKSEKRHVEFMIGGKNIKRRMDKTNVQAVRKETTVVVLYMW